MKRILLTGGAGFIGHHVVEHFLKTTDHQIVIWDKLTYAALAARRLEEIGAYPLSERVDIFTHDLASPVSEGIRKMTGRVDYIVHMAAETHVDNSISNPAPFVHANILGTFQMLEYAKTVDNLQAFVYFSTDEIFGPAPPGVAYKEWDRYNSTNPYSATKAGGEELCLAWANTYKLPVIITHTMNAFGERQHPEKFIPLVVRKVMAGEPVTIHASPDKLKSGSRFYIHCRNIASAISFLLEKGQLREKYNVVGEKEVENLGLAKFIADVLGKKLDYNMVDFHSSRPGHDLRYALDGSRMRELGWSVPKTFEQSLEKTILWMVNKKNLHWLLVQ